MLSETLISVDAPGQAPEMVCPFASQKVDQAEVNGQIPAEFWNQSPSTHPPSLTHYHPLSLAQDGYFPKRRGLHVLKASTGMSPSLVGQLASGIHRAVKEHAHAITILLPPDTGLEKDEDPSNWKSPCQSLKNAIRQCGPKGQDGSIPLIIISQGTIPAPLTFFLTRVDWHVTTLNSCLSPSKSPDEAAAPLIQTISHSLGPTSSRKSILSAALWALLCPSVILRPPEMVALGLSCGFILEKDLPAILDRLVLLTSFPIASSLLIRSLLKSYLTSQASLVSPGLNKYDAISKEVEEIFGTGIKEEEDGDDVFSGEVWIEQVRDKLHQKDDTSPWEKDILKGLDVQEARLGKNRLIQLISRVVKDCQSLTNHDEDEPLFGEDSTLHEDVDSAQSHYVEIERPLQTERKCPVMHA